MITDIAHLDKASNLHFVGIKGVGMAALAKVVNEMGFSVSGSDITDESITNKVLDEEGIKLFSGFREEHVLDNTKLVIYTAAHEGQDNIEVKAAELKRIPVMSYGQALSYIFRSKKVVAVSGTHGKTTTTAMLATILKVAKADPSWIVGTGEIDSLGKSGHYGDGEYAIIEADEYYDQPGGKPKFLHLRPYALIVISLDWDHPDVYPSEKMFVNAFHKLLRLVYPKGILVLLGTDKNLRRLTRSSSQKIRWVLPKKNWSNLKLNVPGEFNRLNATFAATMAHELGFKQKDILKGLTSFTGVQRRLETKGSKYGWLVLDDYAHHPSEIKAAILAIKEKYPGFYLAIAFQSHTFTRTRAFLNDFAKSFTLADCVLVAPIFASARESKPEHVIDLVQLLRQNNSDVKSIDAPSELDQYLRSQSEINKDKIILTMGAGDIYQWIKTE